MKITRRRASGEGVQRRRGPGRRRGDRQVGPTFGAALWLTIVSFFLVVALLASQRSLDKIQQGRRLAISATCAVTSAVSTAGRAVIVGGTATPEGPFERALERLGYPPHKARVKQANAAAQLYTEHISAVVAEHIGGRRAQGLVNPDGTLNCVRLAVIAHAQ